MAKKQKTKQDHEEDALIKEVWEGVREEKVVAFLKDNWKHMAFGLAVFLIVLSGIKIIKNMNFKSALKESALIERVLSRSTLTEKERLAFLKTLSETGSTGYQGVSVLMQADKALKEGRKQEALEILKTVDVEKEEMKNLVAIKLSLIEMDKLSFDEFEERLDDISDGDAFYYFSQLLLGFKAMETKHPEAKEIFENLIDDEATPLSIRSISQEMKNVL
ncbi:MAG: tetratricopeptide repeat protein [Alphaproteobacteria bacterium]